MTRLHNINHADISNCYWGISVSLWFNGCPHKCNGCWNPETWVVDDSLDKPTTEIVEETLLALDEWGIPKDLSLLGGEPFAPYNIGDLKDILGSVKTVRPQTRVLAWTGYRVESMLKNSLQRRALELVDILIDGQYIEHLAVKGHKFGSSNQRVIDVQATLLKGEVVLAPENYENL